MVIQSQNLWGRAGGLEAQRGDLWVLDLEEVSTALKRSPFASRLELPQQNQTLQFARQISFPEARISELDMRVLNTPVLYPGYDDPTGAVRVDFLMDADSTSYDSSSSTVQSTKSRMRSQIHSLLYGWRILTRIGRTPYASEDMWQPLPDFPLFLGDAFKFDLKIYFLKGANVDQIDATSQGMEVSMAFVMKNCWISSLQMNGAEQNSSNVPLTITAAIIPEEIFPFDPVNFSVSLFSGGVNGNIAQRDSAFLRGSGIV
jgi:hypothetical protein